MPNNTPWMQNKINVGFDYLVGQKPNTVEFGARPGELFPINGAARELVKRINPNPRGAISGLAPYEVKDVLVGVFSKAEQELGGRVTVEVVHNKKGTRPGDSAWTLTLSEPQDRTPKGQVIPFNVA